MSARTDDPALCDLGARGTARVMRRVHSGECFDVYQLDAGGRPLCLKVAALDPGRSRQGAPAVFGATRLVGGVSTVWDVISRAGEAVSLAEAPGGPTGWGSYAPATTEAMLEAEAERIRASEGRWNHAIVDVVRCTLGTRQGVLGLLTPWHAGTPFGALAAAEQRRLLPLMMPALWDALVAAAHGDLHGSNIIVSPQADRFVLVDPGVGVLRDLGSDCEISSVLTLTFATSPETYPFLPPYYTPARRLSDGETLPDHWASFVRSLTRSDLAPPFHAGQGVVGHAVSPGAGRFLRTIARPDGEPHPADLLAVGIMYYQALTAAHPFYDAEFTRPAWVGAESVDDRVTGAEPAHARLARPVLRPSALNRTVRPTEDTLALLLLDLRVPRRERLLELVHAVTLAG